MMKLPAELRNRVHELVLVDDTKPSNIRSGKSEDPALLRTSRQIRFEARAIYYCLNEFSLSVSVTKLEQLRQWLEYIKQTCGKLAGTLCVRRCRWSDVGRLLPLAQIAYEGMEVKKATTDYHSLEVLGVIRSVANLGKTAKAEDWGARMVEIKFDEWLLDLLESKAFPKTSLTKQRALGGRHLAETTLPSTS